MDRAFHKRALRLRLHLAVRVSDGASGRDAVLTNLSEGGAFLAVDPPIPIDRGVSFWVEIDGEGWPLRGHVRWTRSLAAGPHASVGSGVELYDPDGALAVRLRAAIDRLRRRRDGS